ncbi:MAG: DUF4132 domain-containing protein [Verrucomicrobia bacterium]|nr:DUF4132 domain-containing protein [Verrucomicrobiota bacterium]
MQYLATGQDESVLGDLAGLPAGAGVDFEVACCNPRYPCKRLEKRQRMLLALEGLEPVHYVRLAKIYEAVSYRDRKQLLLDWIPGAPVWLDVYVQELTGGQYYYGHRQPPLRTLAADLVEQMLAVAGEDTSLLAKFALWMDPHGSNAYLHNSLIERIPGLSALVCRYPDVIRAAMTQAEAPRRVHALTLLAKWQLDMAPFTVELVDAAVDSAKTVRQAANLLVVKFKDAAKPLILRKFVEGQPEERLHALALADQLGCDPSADLLRQRLEAETSPRVKKAIERLLSPAAASPAASPASPESSAVELPPVPAVDSCPKVSDSLRAHVREAIEQAIQQQIAACQKAKKSRQRWYGNEPKAAPWGWLDGVVQTMQTLRVGDEMQAARYLRYPQALRSIAAHPDIQLVHLLRLMRLTGDINRDKNGVWQFNLLGDDLVDEWFRSHHQTQDLRYVAAALRVVGVSDDMVGHDALSGSLNYWQRDPSQAWQYFWERIHLIEECFAPKGQYDYWYNIRRSKAYAVLAAMPQVPPQLAPRLWETALGAGKSERLEAQKALERCPGKEERIIQELSSGRQGERAGAAEWLGELKARQAVPELQKALKKEKSELAKAAMMSALEAMAVPVDEFLDRAGLIAEAKAGLAKGMPAGLDWVQVQLVPPVHWADSGQMVDREILAWMIVKAYKVGDPEPSPMLRRYAQWFRKDEAERLGQWVLENWIGKDTIPIPREQAIARARQQAKMWASYDKTQTEEDIFQTLLPGLLRQPAGSAVKERGVLAVAAACCGPGASAPVEQYLKTWYGYRAAQCKALIRMLAWVEHASATQLVLSVANRFRTAGIRKEADAVAQALAQRKNWTRDELADRTIPTAGLDDTGQAVLDAGPRQLTMRLSGNLDLELVRADGKSVRAFPARRQDEQEEAYKKAKAAFSAAKKELAAVLRLQKDRLYEAMCTQRIWVFDDWDRYLHRHPIVGRCCQRLVWAAFTDGVLLTTFRPLEDRSLSGVNDEAVTVPADAVVRVAHTCNVSPDLGQKWTIHLTDYKVDALFQQFGRSPYALSEETRRRIQIEDFKGCMIEAFKLRGAAAKLGYSRGRAEDGGVFVLYTKQFPALGLQANIEFTGNSLPETNCLVALLALSFSRTTEKVNYWSMSAGIPLEEVPAVLLSECYNDIRQMAQTGTGFDPDWEKKSSQW